MCAHAGAVGAKLVYCSTDNVFDGTRGLYAEDDPVNPVNTYGATKVLGEQAVRRCEVPWVIARISIVMGLPMLGDGNSFVSRLLPAFEAEGPVGVPNNEIRSPVDVVTLGRALLELAGNDWTGVIHLAGNDVLDRCELVRRVAACLGHDPARVEPNDPSTIPGRDDRPLDASLSNALARQVLKTPMLGLDAALDLVFAGR
jgi:dTDP-4-dehydrorhamnose reductase